ncbi:MAG: sugar ABC transporter ATP-binding protein [Planctomycetota bacterium]|nr:MAG: sugar ABC transporter ATP-binding protein [Planctomycetota bacterium]
MSDSLIAIRNVTKQYPGVRALDDVSLEVVPGELLAIVGENGAGKSTLMKILSGVITDYDGEILLRGRRVRFGSTRDAEHSGVSIIHQELNLVEQLSGAANIYLGRERRTGWGLLDQEAMDRSAGELLAELECHFDPRRPVGQLRVGDQQLIEIAKALSLESEILIMDEPTSALTESEVERLFRVIERLRSRGVTVLYISHKMDEVFHLADRIAILRDGQLVDVVARGETDPKAVTHLMVGREIEEADVSSPRSPGEEVLSVEHLWLPWPGHARQWRLEDVSFALRRGEIVGIAGLMGAGRTELLECLFGASAQQPAGTIRLDGQEVAFDHPADACRAGVSLVTEDRKRLGLFAEMSVGANITLRTLGEMVWAGLVSSRKEQAAAEETVAKLGIKTAGVDAPITSLSGGNQQKAIIGRWLLARPKVLLLDDPTRGVDVGAKAELYRLMDGLCRQGLGILVTSSELPELLVLCDRILVLCEGRLTGEFSRAEATEQRIMEAATARRSAAAG